MTANPQILHASCVSWEGRGALIVGAAGSGKSSLALRLIGMGCELVADDRTQVSLVNGALVASCPPAIQGKIEARGMGILTVPYAPQTVLCCAIQMDLDEESRFPQKRVLRLLNTDLRHFHKPATEAVSEAIMQYLRFGALTPE